MHNQWSKQSVWLVSELSFAAIVGTFTIWYLAHKLRNFNRWNVVYRNTGSRYVRTWHGWAERGAWERRHARKASIKRVKTDWLRWRPTHENLEWIFWDPSGEGKKRYDEQRAKSLMRYIPAGIRRHFPGFGQMSSLSAAEEGQAQIYTSPRQAASRRHERRLHIPSHSGVENFDHPGDRVSDDRRRRRVTASTAVATVIDTGLSEGTVRRRRAVSSQRVPLAARSHAGQLAEQHKSAAFRRSSEQDLIHKVYLHQHAPMPNTKVADEPTEPRIWSSPVAAIRRVFSLGHSSATDIENDRSIGEESSLGAQEGLLAPYNSKDSSKTPYDNHLLDYERAESIDDTLSLYSGRTSFSTYKQRFQSNGVVGITCSRDDLRHDEQISPKLDALGRSPSRTEEARDRQKVADISNADPAASLCSLQQASRLARSSKALNAVDGDRGLVSPMPNDVVTPSRKRPLRHSQAPPDPREERAHAMDPNLTKPMMLRPSRAPPEPPSPAHPPRPKLKPAAQPTVVPSINLPGPAAPPPTLHKNLDDRKPALADAGKDPASNDPHAFVDQMNRRLDWYQWNLTPGDRHDAGMGLQEIDHMDQKRYWNGRPHMERVRIAESEKAVIDVLRGKLRRRKSMSDLHVDHRHLAKSTGKQPQASFSAIHHSSTSSLTTPTRRRHQVTTPTPSPAPLLQRAATGSAQDVISRAKEASHTLGQEVSAMQAAVESMAFNPHATYRPEPTDIRIDTAAWMRKRPPVAGGVPLEEFRHPHRAMRDVVILSNQGDGGEGDEEVEAIYTDGRGRWKVWDDWQKK